MISGGDGQPDPYQAFRQGRLAVDRHMAQKLQAGKKFKEETLTDLLLAEAHDFGVRSWDFTKEQEGLVGADWLWWWIDSTGTSYGMLVQAKILKHRWAKWHVDFGYRRKKSQPPQIDRLMATSEMFSVPAAHVLYCGTLAYRASLDCGLGHPDGAHCRDRERAGVSIVPSLIPQYLTPRVGETLAVEAFHYASPLEDIADPRGPQPPLRPLAKVHPDVAEFMRRPQIGARRVAKAMLERAHAIRMGHFSAASAAKAPAAENAVFPQLPADHGHFSVPYLAHVLRGLRHGPPDYVQDLLNGRTPPPWVTDTLAGIVVIRDPEPATRQLATPVEHDQAHSGRHLALVQSADREHSPAAAPGSQAG